MIELCLGISNIYSALPREKRIGAIPIDTSILPDAAANEIKVKVVYYDALAGPSSFYVSQQASAQEPEILANGVDVHLTVTDMPTEESSVDLDADLDSDVDNDIDADSLEEGITTFGGLNTEASYEISLPRFKNSGVGVCYTTLHEKGFDPEPSSSGEEFFGRAGEVVPTKRTSIRITHLILQDMLYMLKVFTKIL